MMVPSKPLYTSVCIILFHTLKNPYAVRNDIGLISTSGIETYGFTAKRTSQEPPKIFSMVVLGEGLYRTKLLHLLTQRGIKNATKPENRKRS